MAYSTESQPYAIRPHEPEGLTFGNPPMALLKDFLSFKGHPDYPALPVRERDLPMKRLVGFAGMFLLSAAGGGQPWGVAVVDATVATAGNVTVGRDDAASLVCQSSSRHKPAPELLITITPSNVKIIDTSKRGTPLAKVTARWSNGEPYHGKLRLTKNPGRICRLVDMELRLGRDTTKADDYTTSVCTVTTSK